MIFLFSFLDQQKQCDILGKVARRVSCNISTTTKIASNFTTLWKGTYCQSKPMNKQCHVDDKLKLKVHKIYLKRLAKLFTALPLPFKCLIIKSVASVSNYDTSHQQRTNNLKITLQQAEQETEKLFTSVKLDSKCSAVAARRNHTVMKAALVNMTVQLHNTTQIQWIKYFKKEATQIFFEYMTNKTKMQQPSNSNRPVQANSFSKRRGRLISFKKGSIRTDVRKVAKGKNGKFTMCFGIKVRSTSGEYKNWGNAKDIARSLKYLQIRNERLKASILKIRKLKKSKPESLSEAGEPLLPQVVTIATTLFPMYLKNYYRRIKLGNKCYFMLMVGETLNKKLNTVEHLYHTLERLSKKNFCSRATRPGPKGENKIKNIIVMLANNAVPPRITTPRATPIPNLPVSLIPPREGSGEEEKTNDKTTPEDGEEQASASTEEEIFALEIALFAMVAFLCVAFLAFTINCVKFVMKSRSYANNRASLKSATNNTVLTREVFSRVSTNVPNNKSHVDVSTHLRQSQNVSNPLWAICPVARDRSTLQQPLNDPQDSIPATSDRSTPQQTLNNPLPEGRDERPLQVDSCEDTKTSCSRTKTLQPVEVHSEELQNATRSPSSEKTCNDTCTKINNDTVPDSLETAQS